MIHSLLLGTLIFTQAQLDRSTPEATIRSFAASIEALDWKAASTCVKGALSENVNKLAQILPPNAKIKFTLKDFESTVLPDGKAEVSFNNWAEFSAPGQESSSTSYGERISLEKVGEVWLVIAPSSSPNVSTPLHSLSMMFTQPIPDFARAKQAAISTTSISNLKQIAVGVMIYASDHKEKLPTKAWKKDLLPYLKNDSIMRPPRQDNSPETEYLMNAALMGKNMDKLKFPAITVLAYEARGGQVTYNHSGKAAVAFADGHVKLVSPEEMKKVRWTP